MTRQPLRVALVGCVASTEVALRTLLQLRGEGVETVGLVTRRASKFNADFVDLAPLAHAATLPVLALEDGMNDAHVAPWLQAHAPDITMVVGWSRMLGPELLAISAKGTVGYHPAALPANRGRHPIIWALALGLHETASSFFLMGAGADDGPVLHQVRVPIDPQDDAGSLYAKLLALIPRQISQILKDFIEGSVRPVPQDPALASSWRKRSAADGSIDWRMSSTTIHNLVRALARPYPGAHFLCGTREVKVWKCRVEPVMAKNAEPGKVLFVERRDVLVKTGDSAIRLFDLDINPLPRAGDYL